jgi:hypothetical protein
MRCFECGSTHNLIKHHVVPRSEGGKKTLFLCQKHHDIVHGIKPRNISISELAKKGIQKARERGVQLGNPNPANALKKALEAKRERSRAFAVSLAPVVKEIQRAGMTSLRQIAFTLSARGHKTPNGKEFKAQSVKDLLKCQNLKT